MKKLILFLAVFAFVFTSCSSDDDSSSSQDQLIGIWKYFKYIENGVELQLDPCEDEETLEVSANGEYILSFYEEVTGNCELGGTSSGTWENVGNSSYSLTFEGFTETEQVTFDGNTFYIEDIYEFGDPNDPSDDIVVREVYIRQ